MKSIASGEPTERYRSLYRPGEFIVIIITTERVEISALCDNFLLYSVNNVQFLFSRPYSNVAYNAPRPLCPLSANRWHARVRETKRRQISVLWFRQLPL